MTWRPARSPVSLLAAGLVAAGLVATAIVSGVTTLGADTADGAEPSTAYTDRDPVVPPDPGSLPRLPQSFAVRARAARPAGSQVDVVRPRQVRLPSGRVVPLRPASTSADGLLQVPGDISSAGWWDGGARLGERYGAMLVAGHVDSSSQGLGPFAELLGVRQGQAIEVRAHDRRQRFAVTDVELVLRRTLDHRGGLFSQRGDLRLVLVTCAGPFVPARGGYQNLAVVTALPSGPAGSG